MRFVRRVAPTPPLPRKRGREPPISPRTTNQARLTSIMLVRVAVVMMVMAVPVIVVMMMVMPVTVVMMPVIMVVIVMP